MDSRMRPPNDEEMALIVGRAKRLFQSERKPHEQWGEPLSGHSPQVTIIDDKRRVTYLNRALEQLETEGIVKLSGP